MWQILPLYLLLLSVFIRTSSSSKKRKQNKLKKGLYIFLGLVVFQKKGAFRFRLESDLSIVNPKLNLNARGFGEIHLSSGLLIISVAPFRLKARSKWLQRFF